jgi:hypothetical protein
MQKIVLVVGMARSGTTLVSHILGSMNDIHTEIEPHVLWKSGNFHNLCDDEYDCDEKSINFIRKQILNAAKGKNILEKSPINCLRPHLVHATFPDAKIVYTERDPVRCIYSNYKRSQKKDSFKLSIILKKYFIYTGSADKAGAISDRKLYQQLRLSDIPAFIRYTCYMVWTREIKNVLPFGPKLKDFATIVKEKGLLHYHAAVLKKAINCKEIFKKLYGDNMQVFQLEDIMTNPAETQRLIEFSGFDYQLGFIEKIMDTFDPAAVKSVRKNNSIDEDIRNELNKLHISDLEHA